MRYEHLAKLLHFLLGDLTLMTYDPGQIDINATEMGVNDVQVFFKDASSGNGTTWSYVDASSGWFLFASPDFLTFILKLNFYNLKFKYLQTCFL